MSAPYILVVDDDKDIRTIVELAMRFEGIRVESAENGAAALEKLRAPQLPIAIFVDLMMPVMDGWRFSEAVAADPRLNSIPITVMTAFEDVARPMPKAADVIRKPMSLATLRNAIGKYRATSP